MMMNKAAAGTSVFGAIALVMLTGCANGIPKGTLSYYLPKAETTITVTQTLTCNPAGDALLQVVTVNPSTTYSSDTSQVMTINPRSISSSVSDADVSFSFTDDGRLSGVNTSSTGQGGAIVKNVLAVAKVAGVVMASASQPTDDKAACTAIGVLAPKTKAEGPPSSVTITYVHSFGYDASTGNVRLISDDGQPFVAEFGTSFTSNTYYRALKPSIPKLGFDVAHVTGDKVGAPVWAKRNREDIVLPLNALTTVKLSVRGLKGDLKGVNREPIWSGEVLVPLTAKADLIDVPIPKPAFFGQRKFSLTLAASGSITKIGYASTGASDTIDAMGSIGSAVLASPKELTVAQQAAALQAQADLIFQQQRLVNCQAKPESCTK